MQEITKVDRATGRGQLILGFATTDHEIELAQRLRYNVYANEMKVFLPNAKDGIDKDRYDPFCEHIIVVDTASNQVVGTYRMMNPTNADKAGGYYSESEFDLSSLNALRHELAECGRSCVHADYRDGQVILLLWMGMIAFVNRHGLRYMLGCASVPLDDQNVQASYVWSVAQDHLKKHPEIIKVKPLVPYPLDRLTKESGKVKMPPLIKGYLKVGAIICGEPAWDKDFNSADFPVMFDMKAMDSRYRKHFGLPEE